MTDNGINGGESTYLPEVVSIDSMKAMARYCPKCQSFAVVPLTQSQRAKQPDSTTFVCHPSIGGCNQGYGPR